MNTNLYADVIKLIKNRKKVAIFSHISPDGDTLGAGLALYKALQMYGSEPYIFCADKVSDKLKYIPMTDVINTARLESYDLSIAVDTASAERLGEMYGEFIKAKKTLVIDHHPSNTRFAAINYVIGSAAATCEIMYSVIKDIGCIDSVIAKQLYCGLVTDTGGFGFSSVTQNTLQVASELIAYDFKAYEIYEKLIREISPQAFRLKNRALDKSVFYEDGQIGFIGIRLSDFEAVGASESDTEGIINAIRDVKGVRIAVIVSEYEHEKYKISFRTDESVNANYIAMKFGGGGHKNASGCRIKGNYEETVERLLKACSDELGF